MKLSTHPTIAHWLGLWNNRPYGPDKPPAAPAYVKGYGSLVAGLMQSRPPTVEWASENDEFTNNDLASLVDEIVAPAAGLGAAYMRPVLQGDKWLLSVETPDRVIPVWSHHQLVAAHVWTAIQIGGTQDRLALVETWNNTNGQVEVGLYKVNHNDIAHKISTPSKAVSMVKDHQKATVQMWVDAVENPPTQQRYLVPFVWQFVNHQPAPIYDGSEGLIEGLIRLNDQEQDDGEMARHRLIIDQELISYTEQRVDDPETNTYGQGQQQNTFTLRDNLLRVNRSQMAAQAADSSDLIQPVTFPDSLTQRERIERRENAALEAIGINPQSVGRSVAGRSDSAAAKRADQQMTMQTVSGPARNLTLALTIVLEKLAALNDWPTVTNVTVNEGLKPDAAEGAATADVLNKADAASTETLIRTAHPTWADEQVTDELDRMAAEGRTIAQFTE